MKQIVSAAVAAAVLLAPVPGAAQQGGQAPMLPAEFVEALQTDVATLRMDAMQSTIQLKAGEAATFWAIYDEFLGELNTRTAGRAELIKDYALQYETLSDAQATELGHRAIKMETDRMALIGRYFDRISKEVSGLTAAQFYQIEQQTQMLINLRLAMEVPIVGRR